MTSATTAPPGPATPSHRRRAVNGDDDPGAHEHHAPTGPLRVVPIARLVGPGLPPRRLRGNRELPVPASSFVGREGAKEEVARRLRASGLVTLTGPGGVGKTRLALEVAADLADHGQRVVFVGLDAASGPGSVLPAVAAALRAPGTPGGSALEATVAHVGDDSLLLVLDNAEHLRAGCASAAEALLRACGGLRLLATSRERLGAAGEVVWPVPPLSLPAAVPAALPEALAASEAVQLFCERAAALHPGFVPTADDVEVVVEICRRLDGNALAIELAAARVVALSPAEIAARLDRPFALLSAGASTAPERHRSLWATLEWSYRLLSPAERALLARLAVFPASFGLDAAEAICAGAGVEAGQVLELLTSLVDRSLVRREPRTGPSRFRLSATVRAYAAERLEETGGRTAQGERHAAWCLELVEGRPGEDAEAPVHREWVESVEAEEDNLGAALEWALVHDRADLALRLVGGQMPAWARRGRFGEVRRRLERVLGETEAAPEGLRAVALHDAGRAALMMGDLDAAERHLGASTALSAKGVDPRSSLRTRTLSAFVSTFGDPASVRHLEQVGVEAAASDDDSFLAEVLVLCGQARMSRGEPGLARRHFEASLPAARRAGCQSLATALAGLGSAELAQGEYRAAEDHLHESATLAAASGDASIEVAAISWMAELAQQRGDHEEARTRFDECLRRARDMAAPHPLAWSLLGLARAVLEGGDAEGVQPLFAEAVAVARRAGLGHLCAVALAGGAEAALRLGDLDRGRAGLDEALRMATGRGDKAAEALALEGWAELRRLEGDVGAAASHVRQALALQAEIGDPASIARCLETLGSLKAVERDFTAAARLLGAAACVRDRHGCARSLSHRHEHAAVAERVRRALGQETAQAEWRRGEALSIEAALHCAEEQRRGRPSRASKGWGALTAAERKVAELAARGRTNAEIARDLGIAEATVKAHLRRVFAKLGVQNRTCLAAEMHGDTQMNVARLAPLTGRQSHAASTESLRP